LYLPASRTNDSERCNGAGIPVGGRDFKTKQELAVDIIKHQLEMGITFGYIGADGLYGNDAAFAREIGSMGLVYMPGIHSDQQISLEKPELYLPGRETAKGVLKGLFHFREVYMWNKNTNAVESKLLVVSKRGTRNGEEIKYSFTNASLGQYTEHIACMQALWFFVGHSLIT
jgi:hypothetical protein